ncbi:KCP protein, partial [Pygoscelis papua]
WWFNVTGGSCQSFVFGGCEGNGNNFPTERECRESCLCRLPKAVGRCRASMPRWWFNVTGGSCQSFVFGGCEGNGNNFPTERECRESC